MADIVKPPSPEEIAEGIQAGWNALTPAQREQLEAEHAGTTEFMLHKEEIKQACKDSLDFLGMLAMPEDIKLSFPDLFHQLWQILIEKLALTRDFSKMAIALPRGHGKTIVLKLLIVYTILYTKKKFILVVGAVKDLAENIIADVVEILDSENILSIFGNWRYKLQVDRQDFKKFIFLGRPVIIKAIGAGTAMRGINVKNARPDAIFCDDAQTIECSQSITEAQKFQRWFFGTLMKAKSPEGCLYLYIGNMYPDLEIRKNIYGCLLRNLAQNKHWVSIVLGAILADGTALWEELIPLQQLLDELEHDRSQGQEDTYYAEVLNDPQAFSGRYLDVTKLAPWKNVGGVSLPVGRFIIIDPMCGKKDPRLDDLAIGLFEVHEGKPVLVKLSRVQLNPAEVIFLCLKWCAEYDCRCVIAEAVGYQSTLLFWFDFICQQNQIEGIELLPVLPHGRPKNSRILEWFKYWMGGESEVAEELYAEVLSLALSFNPLVTKNRDDVLDIMAYANQVLLEYPDSIWIPLGYGNVVAEQEGGLISSSVLE